MTTVAQCVNCPNQVANETANSTAPACDECRARWRDQAATHAIRTLLDQGYTIITPGGQTLSPVQEGV